MTDHTHDYVSTTEGQGLRQAILLLARIEHSKAVQYTPGPVHVVGAVEQCTHPVCKLFQEYLGLT